LHRNEGQAAGYHAIASSVQTSQYRPDLTESGIGTARLGKLDNAFVEKATQGTRQAEWCAGREFFDSASLYRLDLAKTRLNV